LTVVLTLAITTMLFVALAKVGHRVINTERARITSQVAALAAVYGGEPVVREIAQINHATLCDFHEPASSRPYFAVCVEVEGIQRLAHAVDTWSNAVPTLEP